MTAIPTTRYVKSDDVHVAYQVIGDGPVDVLWVPGFVSHVEAGLAKSPQRAAFLRRLSSFCRLILFDKRGTGMSDRGSQIFTLEQRMHDVQAILDEIGSERAVLFGVSEGGPMSLLYAATYPERTAALGPVRQLRQAELGARLSVRLEGRAVGARACGTSITTGERRREPASPCRHPV